MTEARRDFFETLAKVLLRCWLFGFALLLFSFVVFMMPGKIIDDIHGRMFGLTPHELDLIFYCWLGGIFSTASSGLKDGVREGREFE